VKKVAGQLENKWYVHHGWTESARAASLAVRRAKAAARAAASGGVPAETSAGGSGLATSDSSSAGGASSAAAGTAPADDSALSDQVRVSGFSRNSRGTVAVGFTDSTVSPPVPRLIQVGREDGGWTCVSADLEAGAAVLEKDGKRITVSQGGGVAAPADAGAGAPAAATRYSVETAANAGIDAFHAAYGRWPVSAGDCKKAAVLSGAGAEDTEAVEEWVRERASDETDGLNTDALIRQASDAFEMANGRKPETDEDWSEASQLAGAPDGEGSAGAADPARPTVNGDGTVDVKSALEDFSYNTVAGMDPAVADALAKSLGGPDAVGSLTGAAKDFMEAYAGRDDQAEHQDEPDDDPAIHARALEMVQGEGPDAEPPSFDDLTAVFNFDLENCKTPQDRLDALNEYRASLAAGQMMWDNAAISAFTSLNGHAPATLHDRRAAYKLAGVPKSFTPHFISAPPAVAPAANRRARRLAVLSNRAGFAADRMLANIGWTDSARAAALAVRRGHAVLRSGVVLAPAQVPVPAPASAPFQVPAPVSGPVAPVAAPVAAPVDPGRVWVAGTPGENSPPRVSAGTPPEGTVVRSGGGVSVVLNGQVTRIGSSKLLSVLPDGTLGVTLAGGKFISLGDASTWSMDGSNIFRAPDGKFMLDCGKGWLDLETGDLKKMDASSPESGVYSHGGSVGFPAGKIIRNGSRPRGSAAGVLANIGWTDEARAASLAVRRGGGGAAPVTLGDPLGDAKRLLAVLPGGPGNHPPPAYYEAARKGFFDMNGRDPRSPSDWAQAFYFLTQSYHANRRAGVLRNTWSDSAREASILVRQAKAAARSAVQRGPSHSLSSYHVNSGVVPPSRIPTENKGFETRSGGVWIMRDGVPFCIGSSKFLSVGPDGDLSLTLDGHTVSLGDELSFSQNMLGGRNAGIATVGGKLFYRRNGHLVSLDDGSVRGEALDYGPVIGGKSSAVLPRGEWWE